MRRYTLTNIDLNVVVGQEADVIRSGRCLSLTHDVRFEER